jgi:hypothetical protein
MRQPSAVPSSSESEKVIDTIDFLRLDPEKTILVGSAALALYGYDLHDYDPVLGNSSPRPSDLDFATLPTYMNEIHANGINGLVAVPKPHLATLPGTETILTIPSEPLSTELISRYNPDVSLRRYEARFNRYWQHRSQELTTPKGTPFRIIGARTLRQELSSRSGLGKIDPKATIDLKLIS